VSLSERADAAASTHAGLPALRSVDTGGPVLRQLPANLRESLEESVRKKREDDPFLALVVIFERMYDTLAVHADGLEHLADPTVAPPRMIDVWMRCLQLDRLDQARPELPLIRRRSLLAAVGPIIRRRGTCRGLRELLNLLLFGTAVVEEGGVEVCDNGGVVASGERTRSPLEQPEVTVRLPHAGGFEPDELVRIVRHEVPVHVRIVVTVAREGGVVEEIYRGPATGPPLTEGVRP
jgi:phage tail-like protein